VSDDIRPGDVVVCVDVGNVPGDSGCLPIRAIRVGGTYRVRSTFIDFEGDLCVTLVGITSDTRFGGYFHGRFRKIDPADEQFVQQVRACRPIKQREPA
jgi:hypothetical protein